MQAQSILLIGWFFYPKTGGAESILLNQARELLKRGHQVTVLTSTVPGRGDESVFGVKVIRRSWMESRFSQNAATIEFDLAAIMAESQPSLVHFHNGSYPSGGKDKSMGATTIQVIFACLKKYDVPIIEHAHNAQLKDPDATKPLRNLPWDHLICVSHFVEKEWLRLGTAAKAISVIYNGIDVQKFSRANASTAMQEVRKKGGTVLFFPARMLSLTTGELNDQKNITLVLDALNLLINQGVKDFVLVGIANEVLGEAASNNSEGLRAAIEMRGLEKHVVLLPVIDPNTMPEYYAGIDILCVPAKNETFGLMYIEAMAAGKVVIASNTGGPPEYIRNGENGFFVDAGQPKELAEVLGRLIGYPELRRAIGEQARGDAQAFTQEKMVDAIEQLYQTLLRVPLDSSAVVRPLE